MMISHNISVMVKNHNMYSFDMKTPSPAKGFACLIAKATSDESKLWHRRLGHINFKNLNKLVKGNLVRGISEETNSAGSSIASEEKDEEVEIMVVAFSCQIPKKQSIKDNSTNSKQEETLTEPHNE
ncbi:ribonuclease H-like domain-containing protein [Tanacetum coccineum]